MAPNHAKIHCFFNDTADSVYFYGASELGFKAGKAYGADGKQCKDFKKWAGLISDRSHLPNQACQAKICTPAAALATLANAA